MKIKITESQLKQLIKEEATRYRRVLELEKKREDVLKQLSELYDGDYMESSNQMMPEMEEGLFDFMKSPSPGDKRKEIEDYIQNHPSYSRTAAHVAQATGQSVDEVQEQLVNFLLKNATLADGQLKGVMGGISYNKTTREFVNKTKSSGYGPGGHEF
jgi:hypothetical protein